MDADLLSGCTIRVDQYRDAVAKACANAAALGAAKGDRVSLGVEAEMPLRTSPPPTTRM